jgi:hypothetical protein
MKLLGARREAVVRTRAAVDIIMMLYDLSLLQ